MSFRPVYESVVTVGKGNDKLKEVPASGYFHRLLAGIRKKKRVTSSGRGFIGLVVTSLGSHLATLETCLEEKERCSGSFHLMVATGKERII